jgi:hypothetical protein
MRPVGWSRLPVMPPKLSVLPWSDGSRSREVGLLWSVVAEGLVRPDLAVALGEVWITSRATDVTPLSAG